MQFDNSHFSNTSHLSQLQVPMGSCPMDLAPRHRHPLPLPASWPACAQGLLQRGAAWLHTGDTG